MSGARELRFIGEQVTLPDGRRVGEALDRDLWIEEEFFAPLLARNAHGLPEFALVYLELPRGHWKSGGAAAYALAETVLHDGTDVVVAAADADQAGIVAEHIRGNLARNEALRRSVRETRAEFTLAERGSRIRIISSDVPSSWGLGGTHRRFRVICDELTAWPERGEELWQALVSATGKTPNAQTVVLSNAGFGRGACWQWNVRETAERESWAHLYSAPGPIASWIDEAWIERMRGLLPAVAFERLILNRWTSAAGDFVNLEQWRRCVDEDWSPQVAGRGRYIAALDLGLVHDRTALAIVHRDGDRIILDDLQTWKGSRGEPVSIATVERAVLDAARRFRTLRLVCDPWQLKGSVERLRAAGASVREFSFGAKSVERLSAALFSAVTAASLRVYPDSELEREILGLRVVQRDSGWRFDHRSGGYSDRAVALAMAIEAAQRQGPSHGARTIVPRGRIAARQGSRGARIPSIARIPGVRRPMLRDPVAEALAGVGVPVHGYGDHLPMGRPVGPAPVLELPSHDSAPELALYTGTGGTK